MSNVLACDWETFYAKDYGIEECGMYHYLHDPRFDPYLISFWNDDFQWVGQPKDIPWDEVPEVDGYVAMNSAFDRQVFDRAIELGIIPADKRPKTWWCTANLSVFLGGPRSLKDASKALLGVEVDKTMRNYMKGKTWAQAVEAGKDGELMQYALDDSKHCYNIWKQYNHLWPEIERRTAEITFEQTQRGVAVDTKLLDEKLPGVVAARDAALKNIPWAGKLDENGDIIKPLSALALKKWCKDSGVEVPVTTEAKSPEFMAWQERNKDISIPKAMQIYRSANALALKGGTIRRQTRPDGRWPFTMLYYGATTGRWSAGYEDDRNNSGGANIQNLIKEPMYGLDLRRTIRAPKGKKFVVPDFEQVEPRCLAWLCKDKAFIDQIHAGVPLYEAHARVSMGWRGGNLKKENTKVYALAKARIIALSYGAGWKKFVFMAKMYGVGDCLLDPIEPSEKLKFEKYLAYTNQLEKTDDLLTDRDWTEAVNAWKIVTDFRKSNPKITALGKMLETDCRRCHGTTYKIELPSGRVLPYFDVKTIGGLTARKTMDGAPMKIWPGILIENLTQAMARDIMRDAILRLEDADVKTLFTVHDEVVCEVDEDYPEAEIRRLMCVIPDWCPGLPIAVGMEVTDYYKK